MQSHWERHVQLLSALRVVWVEGRVYEGLQEGFLRIDSAGEGALPLHGSILKI